MRLLLVILLLCPLSPPPGRAVQIVYVARPGATFPDQLQTRAAIQAAIDYWQALAPAPVPLTITSERTITADGDIEDSFEWSRPSWAAPPAVTIFVIDTAQPLLGAYLAQSQTALGLVWVIRGDGDGFAATIAHELGHVVYGLPHAYAAVDIMGLDPIVPYQRHFIGCASLARLGRPCVSVWLPLISR